MEQQQQQQQQQQWQQQQQLQLQMWQQQQLQHLQMRQQQPQRQQPALQNSLLRFEFPSELLLPASSELSAMGGTAGDGIPDTAMVGVLFDSDNDGQAKEEAEDGQAEDTYGEERLTLHEPSPPEEAASVPLQTAAVHLKIDEPPAWPEATYVEEEEQSSVAAQPCIKEGKLVPPAWADGVVVNEEKVEEEPPPAWPEGAFDPLEEMESDDDGVEMEEEEEELTAEGAFGHPFN